MKLVKVELRRQERQKDFLRSLPRTNNGGITRDCTGRPIGLQDTILYRCSLGEMIHGEVIQISAEGKIKVRPIKLRGREFNGYDRWLAFSFRVLKMGSKS